jgi:hypothetical protein
VPDHQDPVVALGEVNHLPRLGAGRRERLLDQHVQTLLEATGHDLEVRLRWCADDDRVDARIEQLRVVIGHHGDAGVTRLHVGQAVPIEVHHGLERDLGDLDAVAYEVWAPVAAAYGGNVDPLHINQHLFRSELQASSARGS